MHALAHVVVINVACGRHDQGGGPVVRLVVVPHVVARHCGDGLRGSSHGATDGAVAMNGQLEGIVNRFGGRVLPHC